MKILHCFSIVATASVLLAGGQTPVESKKPLSPIEREIAKLRILTKNPDCSPETWVTLGNALMQRSRDTVEHDFSEAYLAYRSALVLQTDDADALTGIAWVKNSEHDFTAGKMWAKKSLETDPKQVDAHALIGDGAVELGNYDEAARHYQIALNERPDLSALSRSAHLLWVTGDAMRARALMQQAIDAGGPYPENAAWCRAELALMLLNTGALLPAEQQATKALEAAPENPRVLAAMARVFMAKKDYAKAIELYEKSAVITPTHDALAPLVDLYRLTGETEKADRQFDIVVTYHISGHKHADGKMHANPDNGADAQLARFYADQGKNLEDALRQARAAHERSKSVGATDTLAWCLCLNGEFEEAHDVIGEALKWKTPDAEILFHAGMIEMGLKHQDPAKRYFGRALNLNPNFHPARAAIAADMLAKPDEVAVVK